MPDVQRVEVEPHPHRQPVDAVIAALGTDSRNGLSHKQSRERLNRYGKNQLAIEAPGRAWRKLLDQFTDVLVVLLIIAGLISAPRPGGRAHS